MNDLRFSPLPEQTLFFDLPGAGHLKMKAILRGKLTDPTVVFVHGRPGYGNALLQYLGARYMADRGFATVRLFLYDLAPGTRDLVDCTLGTHADDFTVAVEALRKQGAPLIYGVGHSYGGLTILRSEVTLDGAVLWDPSHGLWWTEQRAAAHRNSEKYLDTPLSEYVIETAGAGMVLSRAADEYDHRMGDTSMLASKPYPLKVISAGKGELADLGARYIAAAKPPKMHHTITEAHHGFDDTDATMQELFEETDAWLRSLPERP